MNTSLFDRKRLNDFKDLVQDIDEFSATVPARFDRALFARIRRQTATQAVWADLTGVTQSTIGNWERGYTSPDRRFRHMLGQASQRVKDEFVRKAFTRPDAQAIDVLSTERSLRRSILRAALTDFDFDASTNKIVPIPFYGDMDDNLVDEIAQDRADLLQSLTSLSRFIRESLPGTANFNELKLVSYLQQYESECTASRPNPRLLNRLGSIVGRITNSDDVRPTLNAIDGEAIDGFNRDHLELMRLYFREALAKAQEVDAASVKDIVQTSDGKEFREAADLMDGAVDTKGENIIDSTIPTILRDIANEIRDLNESSAFTTDQTRRDILNRRKSEAFKNGGIYVGRFVFFSALVASLALPGALQVMESLGLIVGITEVVSPGTIRAQYEKLRDKFPALPTLPTSHDRDKTDV